MSSIEELKGRMTIKNGLASANQFMVVLPSMSGQDSRTLNVLCKSVTMPGKQITTLDRNIGIYNQKVVNGFAVDDVTMTFYVLNDYGVKKYFDTWRKKMVYEKEGTVAYKSEYQRTIEIHQLRKPMARFGFDVGPIDINFDVFNASIYSVKLLEAFPVTIAPIELSNDPDGLVEVSVTFAYTNWEVQKDSRSLLDVDLGVNLGGLI